MAQQKAFFEWIERNCHALAGLSKKESSTGTAAHLDRERAELGALLEFAERDLVWKAFDEGCWRILPSAEHLPDHLRGTDFNAIVAQSVQATFLPTVIVYLFDSKTKLGGTGTASKMNLEQALNSAFAEAVTNFGRRSANGNLIFHETWMEVLERSLTSAPVCCTFDLDRLHQEYSPAFTDITHADLKGCGATVVKMHSATTGTKRKRPKLLTQIEALKIWE